MSADNWDKQIDEWLEQNEKDNLEITQQIAEVALRRIIDRTPVASGALRANWKVGIGSPDGSIDVDATDPNGSKALAAGLAEIKNLKPGQVVNISNSLAYALDIEEGRSAKAPSGMVAVTAHDLQVMFDL